MAIRMIYDSEADIPERLRAQATQRDDGKFELDGTPLVNKHLQLQRELQRNRETFSKYGGEDPNAVRNLLDEVNRFREADRETERIVEELERKHQTEQEAAQQERDVLMRHLADRELEAAIVSLGGKPKLLRPHLSGSIKAELQRGGALRFTVVDESGQPRTDKTGLPMSLRGAIETLRQDPDFAAAFASANASRKESGIEGLPFQPARQQIRLTREQAKNTEIYREAVKQAGVNNVIIADE